MHDTFKAYVIEKHEDGRSQSSSWREMRSLDLMEGDVTVRVRSTTMNYKDALAVTGKSPVVRRFPMIPGIDFAGEVIASASPDFAAGDQVILNGWGVGETHMGGYSEIARVRSDWLLHKPDGLSCTQCMAIGTAGYTAALCVLRLQEHGSTPDEGPVLVTGASGGVGSFAIALLSALGFDVIASTGKMSEEAYLKGLGAGTIVDRAELSEKGRPLGKERFAAAVDSVGGQTLANVLASVKYGGIAAACGLAQSYNLPATVMPFILRNVTLAGVDSVMASKDQRKAAWQLLTDHLDLDHLASISRKISREEIEDAASAMLDGKLRGRVVIDMS
ncbi:acrylyl-CoA reductase (NADPH) [Leisingera thetidis]|uniref:acrylyl-CoA reductase (NADPH) n=1 Tax=Leisingera thetidis TaxID=2930199 RepID=UPI0021F78573|nr:MDR family oxidoreductase [Leisingera thetidis]